MKRVWKTVVFCLVLTVLIWGSSVLADRRQLNDALIRLHVVANSDSEQDQAVKLQVRDAVLNSIGEAMAEVADVGEARAYLEKNLSMICETANAALRAAGREDEAVVTLCKEAFSARIYDTFTLPAGVYEALRITIGEGNGKNWWCVAFPALCVPQSEEAFSQVAADSGLSEASASAMTGKQPYQIRFYALEWIGRLQNSLFGD